MPASTPDRRSPRLRAARRDDLDALLALEAQFPGDRLAPRQLRRHLVNPRARLRVLDLGPGLGGYALVLLRAGSDRARLYSIAVDAASRGRGFGARLLSDAEAQARRAGARAMRLEVRTDNAAAVALYEARGYRRIGEVASYYEDGAAAWRYEKSFG